MKRNLYLRGMLAVVLAATLCAFTPGSLAQSGQEAQPPAQQQPDQQQPNQQQPDQQQSKTFEGKILKMQDGKFALVTGQTPQGQMAGHFLDDQDGASKYEGKQVKVTGTLEEASNTIHVTKIEAA
jgi:hypothetical protein